MPVLEGGTVHSTAESHTGRCTCPKHLAGVDASGPSCAGESVEGWEASSTGG